MLELLRIKNIILIEDLTIEFAPGFNVITGETGAGKSAIIEGLKLFLKRHWSSSIIRKNAEKAQIELVFSPEQLDKSTLLFLTDLGIDGVEDELILKRVLLATGKSKGFINDSPVSITAITNVAKKLINITGQWESFTLVDSNSHLVYLDEFSGTNELLQNYQKKFFEYKKIDNDISKSQERLHSLLEKEDLFKYQLDEIEKANLKINEDTELENEFEVLKNQKKIIEVLNSAITRLYDDYNSAFSILSEVIGDFRTIENLDEELAKISERLSSVQIEIEDIKSECISVQDKFQLNPYRLDEISKRIDTINNLKFKYGNSIKEILAYRDKLLSYFNEIEENKEKIKNLELKKAELRKELSVLAEKISKKRHQKKGLLEKRVEEVLKKINLERAKFQVRIEKTELTENGCDSVVFLIETNPEEGFLPIGKVASGGELSRILLALKSVFVEKKDGALYVFDEIDTGISQFVASSLGELLKSLSRLSQVIVITHHPHIAKFADRHIYIEKRFDGKRVKTVGKVLSKEERVKEIARMLGGEGSGIDALKQAGSLLDSVEFKLE